MSSRRRGGPDIVSSIVVLAMVAYVYGVTVEEAEKALIIAVMTLASVLLLMVLAWMIQRTLRSRVMGTVSMDSVDTMTGLEFERFVAELLKTQGFRDVRLTERYDWGVDIIANKDGVRWGIQTKRSSGIVKVAAVRQVVAGINRYGCDRSMVVTNGTYSRPAIEIAACNNCILIDRALLVKLVTNNKGASN